MTFTVQIKVMPLKELLDPQGKAVMGGLENLGLGGVEDVRVGKNITLQVKADTAEKAKQIAEEASKRLRSAGFQKLSERQAWSLQPGGRYFFTRNMSTIVEGEIGMGKSKIIEEFLSAIPGNKVLRLSGISDVVSFNTPYASMRPVVLQILGIGPEMLTAGDSLHGVLESRFGEKASLLNIVLNTEMTDGAAVTRLTGAQRVQATHELLLQILSEQCNLQPVVMVFDDARWLDDFTLRILKSLKQDIRNCMMILAYDVTEGLNQVQD
ncbi:MAG: hypothetical protein EOO88_46025, partial [Pedobacter sp.]